MITKRLSRVKFIFQIIVICFIVGLVYGCGNKNKSNSVRGEHEIWMKNISYIPDTLNIPVGTTVTWVNQDSMAHTVTSADTVNSKILFNSGSIGMHDTFNYTFDSSGIYHFYCKIHSKRMNGIIIVQ